MILLRLSAAPRGAVEGYCGIKIARYSTLHRKLLPAVVLNTSSRSGSTITKIVLDELDKIASAKGSIDLGISPPPPLKLPIAQPPEKYDCELKTIVEDSTKSIDVPDDGLGALDIAERIFREAKADRLKHGE